MSINNIYRQQSVATSIPLGVGLLLALLGAISSYIPVFITIAWAAVMIFSIMGLLSNRIEWLWYCIAASPVLEVWARVGKAPSLPYELGKYYLLFALFLLAIHHFQRGSNRPLYNTGIIIVLALLPSMAVALSAFNYEQWVFNALAIFELAFLLFFASRERWHIERFCKTLQFPLMAIIPFLTHITVKTPDLNDITFSLGANAETSGGFGSNQVSTILGLGIVIAVLLIILKRPLFAITWINYILIGFLLFRGFLTFSRGGMITALLTIIIAFLPVMTSNFRNFARSILLISVISIIGYVVFAKVNDITDNVLLLRYEGETGQTRSGSKEKSLNTITTGREKIALADIMIFQDNIWFGVGPGEAKNRRVQYDAMRVAAHTEASRLLSEHGLGGLAVVLILAVFPIVWMRKQKVKMWKGVVAALFFFAFSTSLHSAMRTNITPVFYALAAIPVFYYKSKKRIEPKIQHSLHRQ